MRYGFLQISSLLRTSSLDMHNHVYIEHFLISNWRSLIGFYVRKFEGKSDMERLSCCPSHSALAIINSLFSAYRYLLIIKYTFSFRSLSASFTIVLIRSSVRFGVKLIYFPCISQYFFVSRSLDLFDRKKFSLRSKATSTLTERQRLQREVANIEEQQPTLQDQCRCRLEFVYLNLAFQTQ